MRPEQFAIFHRIWHQMPNNVFWPSVPHVWVERPFTVRAQCIRPIVPLKEKPQHVFYENLVLGCVIRRDEMPTHQHPFHENVRDANIVKQLRGVRESPMLVVLYVDLHYRPVEAASLEQVVEEYGPHDGRAGANARLCAVSYPRVALIIARSSHRRRRPRVRHGVLHDDDVRGDVLQRRGFVQSPHTLVVRLDGDHHAAGARGQHCVVPDVRTEVDHSGGWISRQEIEKVARHMRLPHARVLQVVRYVHVAIHVVQAHGRLGARQRPHAVEVFFHRLG